MIRKIKHLYWEIIPYNWRPGELWYRFKCFVWKRYTTIKPRYLGHTWADRMTILPHMMFEILSQFIEEECSPGHIDWEASDHRVEINGKSINVRDEMQELYNWWHTTYLKEYKEVEEILWKEANKHHPVDRWEEVPDEELEEEFFEWKQEFKTPEDEAIYHTCLMAINKLEADQHKDMLGKMHRLVNLTGYLWT